MKFRILVHNRRGICLRNTVVSTPNEASANSVARARFGELCDLGGHRLSVWPLYEAREGDPCPRCLTGDYSPRFRNFGCACGGPGCPLD